MTSPEGNQPREVEISPALQEVLREIAADPNSIATEGLKDAIKSGKYFTRPLMPGEEIETKEE